MSITKWAPFATGAILLALCVCGKGDHKKPENEQFVVKKVHLHDVISQTGEVTPVVKVDLKSEASGKIKKIFVKEGQRVTRGQKILIIDPYKLNTHHKNAEILLQKAQIRKALSIRNYTEAKTLASLGTISDKILQDLRSQMQLDSLSCEQQLLEMDDILYQLSQTTVVSPLNGVLTELKVEEGEIATSATSGFQSGTALATIADISCLEVITKIGEVDYVHLKPGQQVLIKPAALENVTTTGIINFIALSAKKDGGNELGTFEVRISIDSLIPGLAPGINVNVEFVVLDLKDIIGIPCHYVKKQDGKQVVQILVDGDTAKEHYKPQPVTIGATDFKHYEIKKGLKEGDVVVFVSTPPKVKNKK